MSNPITKEVREYKKALAEQKAKNEEVKLLRDKLIGYAEEHRQLIDGDFRVWISNDLYASLRMRVSVEGSTQQRDLLIEKAGEQYVIHNLDEKKLIADSQKDKKLAKTINATGCSLKKKENWALYIDKK